MEARLTEANLEDTNISVLLDVLDDQDTLLISFGGIANRLPIPVFEFMNALNRFRVNKVFIRDFNQCWYTSGIRGITSSPDQTAIYLKAMIARYGKRRTVFLGNSAGAYASILYGRMLNVSQVLAFSPQTFIDRWHRLIWWDRRWPQEIARLNRANHQYFDLVPFLKSAPSQAPVFVYYDSRHRLDSIHAKRIKGAGVQLFPRVGGGHAVIKQMRQDESLMTLLGEALQLTAQS